MRVLLATSSYSSGGEGAAAAGLFVHDFAKALTLQGVDVDIVAPAASNQDSVEGRFVAKRFAVPRLPLSLLNPLSPLDWAPIMQTLLAGRRAMLRACAENRPDHILALWALPCGAWARQAAKRHGIPYSTWALGSDIWGLGKLPLIRGQLASVLRGAAYCFADGIGLGAQVNAISGRECLFLPSSRNFGPPPSRPLDQRPPYRFAFLGRWHVNKGPDILLDALARLTPADWTNIEAVRVCGGGPLELEVRTKIEALNAAGHPVQIGGYLDQASAYALFEWADYIVIPSRIESIPVVFSDAMQAHRPVIATPVGDLPDLIGRHACGILADEVSASGLASAIHHALERSPVDFMAGIRTAADIFSVRRAAQDFLRITSSGHGP